MKLNPIYIDLINENIKGAYKFPYYLICHRIPERTFKIKEWYFPVCARCTGIYISGISFIIYAFFSTINLNIITILLAIALLIPMLLDGTSQLLGMRKSNNKIRFITGFLAGFGLIILAKTIRFILFT
ncbi:MAG: DUF2085 domain-containing protein [Methanobrevibacter sp.]|nr:DUF2085 domain-containing protein [Methanobrevibacter sp.]